MLPSQIFCQFKSLFIYYKEISLGNYFLGLKIFSWVKNGTQRLGKSDPDPDKHTSATHRKTELNTRSKELIISCSFDLIKGQ